MSMATKQMSLVQWLISTLIAGIGLGFTILVFGLSYVYPKEQGIKLETRVEKLDTEAKADRKDAKKDREKFLQALQTIDSRLSRMEGRQSAIWRRQRDTASN